MNISYTLTNTLKSTKSIIDYNVTYREDEIESKKIYGICLEMYSIINNEKILTTKESIPSLSYSLKQVHELLIVLYNNLVTPCQLIYIVDDYISSNPDFVFDIN